MLEQHCMRHAVLLQTNRMRSVSLHMSFMVPTQVLVFFFCWCACLQASHDIKKQRLGPGGAPVSTTEVHNVHQTQKKKDGQNITCGSCYGAESEQYKCCNTCDDVSTTDCGCSMVSCKLVLVQHLACAVTQAATVYAHNYSAAYSRSWVLRMVCRCHRACSRTVRAVRLAQLPVLNVCLLIHAAAAGPRGVPD
jgi:hypothetical protein